MTVSSTIPPVAGCKRQESVEWSVWREAVDEGVIFSSKGAAPGPDRRCCTLEQEVSISQSRRKQHETAYMWPTSKRLAFSLVHLWLSPILRSEYCTGIE